MGSFDGSYKNRKRYKKEEEEKYNIVINEETYDLFLYYVVSKNKCITKKCLRDLRSLLDMVDEENVEKENVRSYYIVNIIKEILRLRIEEQIDSRPIFVQTLTEKFQEADWLKDYYDIIILAAQDEEEFEESFLSIEDISYVNHYVSSKLINKQIYIGKKELMPIFENLDDPYNHSTEKLNDKYINTITKLYNNCMKYKAESEHVIEDFELFDEERTDYVITKTVEEYNKENNKVKTGLQRLNEVLNGGYENGRVYNVCALPKSWKSGFLLNSVIWTIKYNDYFDLKNPNKIPTVFYLSMENSVRETINRLYVHLTGKSIKGLTIKQAKKILKELIVDKYGVNLIIKYRPAKSINTLDFDNMIDEIESNGNEIVLAALDYTKRIKSSDYNPELRIELGQVMDDLTVIAKRRNIPILTASQLNRVAYQAVETAIAKGKKDIAKELNNSHIGESVDLIQNADVSFLIYKEVDDQINPETGEKDKWLSIKMMASRDETDDEKGGVYFVQKFDNGMKLEEDEGCAKCLSRNLISIEVREEFSAENAKKKIEAKRRQKKQEERRLNNTTEEEDEEQYQTGKVKSRKPKNNTPSYSKGFIDENNNEEDEDEFEDDE